MTHTPHELHDEFPEDGAKITSLKTSNVHFAKLADAYHELNRAVHRMETGLEAVADEVLEEAKKRRLAMKDEIAGHLAKA